MFGSVFGKSYSLYPNIWVARALSPYLVKLDTQVRVLLRVLPKIWVSTQATPVILYTGVLLRVLAVTPKMGRVFEAVPNAHRPCGSVVNLETF